MIERSGEREALEPIPDSQIDIPIGVLDLTQVHQRGSAFRRWFSSIARQRAFEPAAALDAMAA